VPTSSDIYNVRQPFNITRWVDFLGLSTYEWMKIGNLVFNHLLSCEDRNAEEETEVAWFDELEKYLSEHGYS
jgi:hypothetical protein